MHKLNSNRRGFTIVELLVVIVVIGILATVSIVSFTGINKRATVASIQTDLTSAINVVKMYNIDNGKYPEGMALSNGKYCPTTPIDNRHCYKASPGNTLTYTSFSPWNSFSLRAQDSTGNIAYIVGSNFKLAPAVAASGGTVATANGYRTHTFSTAGGPYTFTVTTGGLVDVVISGGGGGAGGPTWESDCQFYGDPLAGGPSIVSKSGVNWQANGGGAGSTTNPGAYCGGSHTGIDGAPGGTNSPSGWVATVGGGSSGGSKYTWGDGLTWEDYGSNGGNGGKLEKTGLSVNSGDSYTITVGGTDSHSGTAGIVTFSYAY